MIQFCAPLPVSVQVDVPVLVKMSKSRYCAADPILLTLNVPLPVPPSENVSVRDGVTSTVPLIVLVGVIVRLLGWLDAKPMAVPPVPVIVPELVMAVGPPVTIAV